MTGHSRRGGVGRLSREEVDYLLMGRCRARREVLAGTKYDVFRPFLWWVDWRSLWHAHRTALLAEWRRRGGQGEPWAAKQFGGVNE